MKRTDRKSDCAINHSLETIGDPWSMLVVRDIVFFGKKTYGEFLASDERIGTSVLANKLALLETRGILLRRANTADGRSETYHLTEKGLDLIPMLMEMTLWGATYDPLTGANPAWVAALRTDRPGIAARCRAAVARGGSLLADYEEIVRGWASVR